MKRAVYKKQIIFVAIIFTLLFSLAGCQTAEKKKVIVYAAGSLIIPFDAIAKAFEAEHPDIQVEAEYHGSIQVIRQVTDIHIPVDVVATADQALIPMLMYAQNDPDTGKPFATWSMKFATNKLALAYNSNSKYAAEITSDNWYKIISRTDVKLGFADPRFDAVGYRTLMALKLAEKEYSQQGLLYQILNKQFTFPILQDSDTGVSVIRVPEILETTPDAHIVLRGASIQAIALLESGDIDYAFEYESVIKQHDLKMIELPDEINLGNPNFRKNYQEVEVKMDFQRFATVVPDFVGDVISYGITIPANAPDPTEAAEFINFVLGPEGKEIMKSYFHPLLDPIVPDHCDLIPQSLQSYCGK